MIFIYKFTPEWHLLWTTGGCWLVYQSFVKQCWHFTMTIQSDLQRWKTAGAALGEMRTFQQGFTKSEKPEDPGYLLLLAAPWTKRGLSTFSVWLQTMRGFKSTHKSHGNQFQVLAVMWNFGKQVKIKTHTKMKTQYTRDQRQGSFLGADSWFFP